MGSSPSRSRSESALYSGLKATSPNGLKRRLLFLVNPHRDERYISQRVTLAASDSINSTESLSKGLFLVLLKASINDLALVFERLPSPPIVASSLHAPPNTPHGCKRQ